MQHYGQKEIIFECGEAGGQEPLGLVFQVTDVRKPLVSVRRLVERGNQVVLAARDGDSYIFQPESGATVPEGRLLRDRGPLRPEYGGGGRGMPRGPGFARPV